MPPKAPREELSQIEARKNAWRTVLETMIEPPTGKLSNILKDLALLCQRKADRLIDSRSEEINNAPKYIRAGDLITEIADKIEHEHRL